MADWKRAGGFGGKGGDRGGKGGDFKRGSFGKPRFGGGGGFKKDFGGGRKFGGRDEGGEREMFDAVCSTCGKDCQVPFKPNGKSPILCKECFAKSKGDEGGERGNDRGERRSFDRGDRGDREKSRFDTRTSFKDGRPAFTPRTGGQSTPDPRIDSLVTEMQGMNAKLERLITLMSGTASAPVAEKKVASKAKAAPKAKKGGKKTKKDEDVF